MAKISPFLWFDNQAEAAANYYVAIFSGAPGNHQQESKISHIARYGKSGADMSHVAAGSVMTVAFELAGQPFTALNGGPVFQFSPAISFVIDGKSQEEVDYFWDKLSEGGDPKAQQCGWLQDKFGVSWQVVPRRLNELLSDSDPVKAERVMQAMLQMKKIVIADLEKACNS